MMRIQVLQHRTVLPLRLVECRRFLMKAAGWNRLQRTCSEPAEKGQRSPDFFKY
jgi:hypothetical protein